ncbi:MAG: response regulator [Sphingobacteriales bacterium]|nr:MAG: response regulator [Sphingobacteriales bacterium]
MSKPIYILYADDDADDRLLLEEQFRAYPEYTFLSFENGLELTRFLEAPPHGSIRLIILDVNMPKMGGFETLRVIRENPGLRDIAVAVFTTSKGPNDMREAEKYAAAYFVKPHTLALFEDAVRKMLEHAAR